MTFHDIIVLCLQVFSELLLNLFPSDVKCRQKLVSCRLGEFLKLVDQVVVGCYVFVCLLFVAAEIAKFFKRAKTVLKLEKEALFLDLNRNGIIVCNW